MARICWGRSVERQLLCSTNSHSVPFAILRLEEGSYSALVVFGLGTGDHRPGFKQSALLCGQNQRFTRQPRAHLPCYRAKTISERKIWPMRIVADSLWASTTLLPIRRVHDTFFLLARPSTLGCCSSSSRAWRWTPCLIMTFLTGSSFTQIPRGSSMGISRPRKFPLKTFFWSPSLLSRPCKIQIGA